MLLFILVFAGVQYWLPDTAAGGESEGQLRMVYAELYQLQTLSVRGVAYKNYRSAVERAKKQVALLRDASSPGEEVLRTALTYHKKALAIWQLQADSDFPVDSLRTDEAVGAALIAECPGIPTFHYKERDQFYVQDGVDCLWRKAEQVLNSMPPNLR